MHDLFIEDTPRPVAEPNQPPFDIVVGKTYKNAFGDFTVTKYVDSVNVHIKFLDFGFEKVSRTSEIRNGRIMNPYYRSVVGVGYIGVGNYPISRNGKITTCYSTWSNTLNRCYNPNDKRYSTHGAVGVIVCDQWHCYQVFAKWCDSNGWFYSGNLTRGDHKIYSPSTCKYVTASEVSRINGEKSCTKIFKFVNPDGKLITVENLKKFCRDNGLSRYSMYHVHKCRQDNHRGWSRYIENEPSL